MRAESEGEGLPQVLNAQHRSDHRQVAHLDGLVALVGGILILDEQLEPGIAIRGLLTFAGMILTARAGRVVKPIPPEAALFTDQLPAAKEE